MAPLPLLGILGISLNPLTLAKDFTNAIGSAILGAMGRGASALVAALLGFINSTADPSFSSGWWSSSGTALFERVVAVTGSLLARACIRLPVAVLQIGLVVAATGALVAASDEIATEIAHGSTAALSRFVAADMVASITGSGVVGFICGSASCIDQIGHLPD